MYLNSILQLFIISSHLPESLVAAFAKRLSRLALVASPEDAMGLLQLVGNLLLRHTALKRMICCEDTPAVSKFQYKWNRFSSVVYIN